MVKIRVNTTSMMWLVLLEEKRAELGGGRGSGGGEAGWSQRDEVKVAAFCCDKCEQIYPQYKLSQYQCIVSGGLQASEQKLVQ